MVRTTSTPQFSPQDLATLAEIKYQREKMARLEAQRDALYGLDPVNERFVGSQVQADLDEAYAFHGRAAPAQREGESANMYRRRLLAGLAPYSKDADVARFNFTEKSGPNGVPDWAVAKYANQLKSDALSPESHRADVPAGQIKEIVLKDQSGRARHEFVSSDGKTTFIHQIVAATSPRRIVSRMFGMDKIGGASRPIERLQHVGRQPLHHGLPRTSP